MFIKRLSVKSKKLIKLIADGDIETFKYLVSKKVNSKKSDEENYDTYLQIYNKMEKNVYGNCNVRLGIIVWCDENKNGFTEKLKKTEQSLYNQSEKICVAFVKKYDDIIEAVNKMDCDFLGFITAGDVVDRNYSVSIVNAIERDKKRNKATELIYFDLDYKKNDTSVSYTPLFLPDYSPDTLLSTDYVKGSFCVSKQYFLSVADKLKGVGDFFSYQLLLYGFFELQKEKITHLKKILFHKEALWAYTKEENVILDELKLKLHKNNNSLNLSVSIISEGNISHIYYNLKNNPLISIIIPSKDNPSVLENCIESIYKYTKYSNYELIVVDNGSTAENRKKYEELVKKFSLVSICYVYKKMEFNFSKMCNIGAESSKGEYLLFLNDDMEIIDNDFSDIKTDWLGVLAGQSALPKTGAVGAKLYFPNSKLIQHTGIINGDETMHLFSHQEDDIKQLKSDRSFVDGNFLAVTGACLMLSRAKFENVGGFCEELEVTYNDIELCMKLHECGLYNVVRTDVILYHHESLSRGEDGLDEAKFLRHLREKEKLYEMHPQLIKNDSYYSPYLSQTKSDYSVNSEFYVNCISKDITDNVTKIIEVSDNKIVGKIQSVLTGDNMQVRGYAYLKSEKNRKKFKNCIVLEKADTIKVFEPIQIYDTLAAKLNNEKKVNFASFYGCLDIADYEMEGYTISIGMLDRTNILYKTNIRFYCKAD